MPKKRASKKKKPSPKKPKFKTWRVTFEVTRIKRYGPEEKIATADEAEEKAREEVLFDDEMPLDREEIVDTTVRWMDHRDVEHIDWCRGEHCRHHQCRVDAMPKYCTECEP